MQCAKTHHSLAQALLRQLCAISRPFTGRPRLLRQRRCVAAVSNAHWDRWRSAAGLAAADLV